MTSRGRLDNSLFRAFVLQFCLISFVAVSGVYLADFAIREVLIVSALKREAQYFWARHNIDRETPAPNTNTLIGYVFKKNSPEIPSEFQGLSPGIHDFVSPVNTGVVLVTEEENDQLFLVFDADNVGELATYFGILPLALLLIILYFSAWVTYVLIHRAVSPVIQLARSVQNIDLERPQIAQFLSEFKTRRLDSEIETLATALGELLERVDRSIDRERTFTREASHELRSPLTVIKMASSSLSKNSNLDQEAATSIERIGRAAKDMEELTEVLLHLAREYEGAMIKEVVDVNEVVGEEVSSCRLIFEAKGLDLQFQELASLKVLSSAKIVSIVMGNLIRNACSYTDSGSVVVCVNNTGVVIQDSGKGMTRQHLDDVLRPRFNPKQAQGYGIGLNLVNRITDRFGWSISFDSSPETGTKVQVKMPLKDVIKT